MGFHRFYPIYPNLAMTVTVCELEHGSEGSRASPGNSHCRGPAYFWPRHQAAGSQALMSGMFCGLNGHHLEALV